ncbi:hypothetical protein L3Q82_000738 [Scortum barcoo]|uniref:Uncharacterized protein n=1 Tax=Scortum barcoo TaxID=214431 RepID=A0ACB8WDN9_9TELE|nr:hypothetical protein L3Q82_000738 [Scortum barcoo]
MRASTVAGVKPISQPNPRPLCSLAKLSLRAVLLCSAAQQNDDVDEKQTDEDEGEVDEQLLQVPLGLWVHLDLRRSADGRLGHMLDALHGDGGLRDLSWTINTTLLGKKANQRLYFLRKLRKARAPAPIMCTFYRGTIESVLTSGITVWYEDEQEAKQKHFYTDSVPKPTVTTDCVKPSSVKFTCSVHQQAKELTFEWLKNEKPLPGKKDKTLTEIAEKVEKDDFSCKVSNKASSQTSVAVKQNCFENKFIFPEELFGINIWIIVGGGGEEEELRLGWTNPDQQQHHRHHHQHNYPTEQQHHHHHHQQQPAGHTGPRQHRSKQQRDQQRDQQRSRASEHPNGHPHPSPRRPAQQRFQSYSVRLQVFSVMSDVTLSSSPKLPKPPDNDDDQPPPLPQPRKKAPKTPRA